MAYYTKGTDDKGIVSYKDTIPQEAILAIDRADDDAIASRIGSSAVSDHFLYSYPIQTADGTKQIIGIGVDGGYEIARLMGNIEVLTQIKVEEKGDYFYGCVWAKDITRNTTLMGVARQCKYIIGKGNEPTNRLDESAFVKAITKGQRNAILAIAPQEAVAKAIETFIQMKKIKALSPAPNAPKALPYTPKAQASTKSPIDDIQPSELTKIAKDLGYESRDEIYQTLGVKNIGEWKSQGKSLKSAAEFLTKHKSDLVSAIYGQLDNDDIQHENGESAKQSISIDEVEF